MKHTLPKKHRINRSLLLLLFTVSVGLLNFSCSKDKVQLSNLAGLSSFALQGFEGVVFTIDQTALTISNTDSLPYLTSPNGLIAVFGAIPGSAVTVNGVAQQSGQTPNNFTNELVYATTAEDGVTVRNYKVKVNISQIDPNTMAWQQVTGDGGWGTFRTSEAGYFGNNFWFFGAQSAAFGAFNYGAFSSENAVNWNKVTTSIDTLPYAERQTAVFGFQNKVWLLGGLVPAKGTFFSHVTNGVWSSSNGTTWTAKPRIITPGETEMWTGRERINAVAYDNKLWVVGGNAYPAFGNANSPGTPMNDVWSSTDGASWTRVKAVTTAEPGGFIARTNPAVLVHDNKIYKIGGRNASATLLNDIWTTTDGVNWSKLNVTGAFPPVWGHSVVSYNGVLFLLGGYVKNEANADVISNELWISENNGISWAKADASDPRSLPGNFPGRAFFSMFIQDNSIWVIGGEYRNEGNVQAYRNDVWKGALVK